MDCVNVDFEKKKILEMLSGLEKKLKRYRKDLFVDEITKIKSNYETHSDKELCKEELLKIRKELEERTGFLIMNSPRLSTKSAPVDKAIEAIKEYKLLTDIVCEMYAIHLFLVKEDNEELFQEFSKEVI